MQPELGFAFAQEQLAVELELGVEVELVVEVELAAEVEPDVGVELAAEPQVVESGEVLHWKSGEKGR